MLSMKTTYRSENDNNDLYQIRIIVNIVLSNIDGKK